jgi:hypothetical protein
VCRAVIVLSCPGRLAGDADFACGAGCTGDGENDCEEGTGETNGVPNNRRGAAVVRCIKFSDNGQQVSGVRGTLRSVMNEEQHGQSQPPRPAGLSQKRRVECATRVPKPSRGLKLVQSGRSGLGTSARPPLSTLLLLGLNPMQRR